MYDIIIIGNGPAGFSAAITARMREKSVAVISNSSTESGLYKAAEIGNYPGLPGLSGAELSDKMRSHA
ncbi:MAG: NAD(P)/FAD-dependent oxidoreductase, partial [Clostridiales bacterium]|nr:NAD(P)/FAD-dependent oxidoreductase [Clostridiales bacterium]